MRLRALALAAFVFMAVPALSLAELKIATWNIQHLGWQNNKDYEALTQVASHFDFLAIQELMNEEAIKRLESKLESKTGESWSTLYSHALGENTYLERYAFLWRDSMVEYAEGAVVYLDDADQFAREPFSALFRAKQTGFEFVAATVHIVFGQRVADRIPEIHALRSYWDWLAEVYPEHAGRRLLLGDFNLRPSHEAWAVLREVAQPLLTEGASTLSSIDRQYANLFDNIWVSFNHDLPITHVGIMEFPVLLSETTSNYWSHKTARARVSDHAPVFVLLDVLGPPVAATGGTLLAHNCIDLNTASNEDLVRLPHIGTGRAQAINHGRPWGAVDELLGISGIGGGRLADIQGSGLICAFPGT